MEVRFYSNIRRPGVGLGARREASRPMLPQHSRHCPVLEDGSALGFMVYAFEPKESITSIPGSVYKFIYYLQTHDGKRTPLFRSR
jgi:hypothetical protein